MFHFVDSECLFNIPVFYLVLSFVIFETYLVMFLLLVSCLRLNLFTIWVFSLCQICLLVCHISLLTSCFILIVICLWFHVLLFFCCLLFWFSSVLSPRCLLSAPITLLYILAECPLVLCASYFPGGSLNLHLLSCPVWFLIFICLFVFCFIKWVQH